MTTSKWNAMQLDDCIAPVRYTSKVQRSQFLDRGSFPVISQEAAFINGYWDREEDVFRVERPVVVFGDHTRSFKYVDFDFVLGADGVKVLQPKPFLDPKYFYYQLQTARLKSLGYARHFRLLRDHKIEFPSSVEEQRLIASRLEAFEERLTRSEELIESERNAAREYLQAFIDREFDHLQAKGWSTFGAFVRDSRGGVNIGSGDYADSGIPVLTKGDVKPLGLVEPGGKFVRMDSRTRKWPRTSQGNLIVTTRDLKPAATFLGLVGIVPGGTSYIVNQGATVFSLTDDVDPQFFVYWCSTTRYRAHVKAKKTGSTQVHIRQDDLFSAPVPIFSPEDQRLIVERISTVVDLFERFTDVCSTVLASYKELWHAALSNSVKKHGDERS